MTPPPVRHLVDVHTYVGGYPFRHVPHPEPAILARVLAREGVAAAWTGHLPSPWYRDPTHGNEELYAALAPHRAVLRPTPAIRSDWPGWERALARAVEQGAPAVRAYPAHWGWGADAAELPRLGDAAAEAGLALVLPVRFEDLRQRSRLDVAGDLATAAVRAVARRSRARVVVLAAGRDLVEEVHWGLTPDEPRRVWWDISWIWGPPEDHLAHLFRTLGSGRFVFGTGWPLRLTQAPTANLELLPDDLRGSVLGDATRLDGASA